MEMLASRNEAPAHHDASLHAPYSYSVLITRMPMPMSMYIPCPRLRSRLAGSPTLPRRRPLMVMLLSVQKQQIQQRRGVTPWNTCIQHHTVSLLTWRQRARPMMHHITFDYIKRNRVGKPHRVTYIVSTIPRQAAHQMPTLLHLISDQINLDARPPIHRLARPHAHEAPAGLDSCRARHCSATGIVTRSPGKSDFFSLQQLISRRLHGDAKKIFTGRKPACSLAEYYLDAD
ncbi:hypothetical protein J3F84DRAFT_177584 [Trichoderma pleuroticola]